MHDQPDVTADPTDAQAAWQGTAISPALMASMRALNECGLAKSASGQGALDGGLAVHCRVDLASRRVVECASMAGLFSGYESLLPGRDLQQVGRVSAVASGLCGGVHATASALCLEMALGLAPPPLGIVLRNLLLSCQSLNDGCMHLFVLAGPDYSRTVVEATNPELWARARRTRCRFAAVHGHRHVGDIMAALEKETGPLYREALAMSQLARRAYALLGGKYPHSETIIPGGVALDVDAAALRRFDELLRPFAAYARRAALLWDDVFDFMLEANPLYGECGRGDASLLDFGQWDHPLAYDGRYASCDDWGRRRWATPGLTIDGHWRCGETSLLNAGIEEHLEYSYQTDAPVPAAHLVTHDPNGNPVGAKHPWNRVAQAPRPGHGQAYSWGSSLTWRGHGFETGTGARLYLTALARESTASRFVHATGSGLELALPLADGRGETTLHWRVPATWNTFERNRARAHSLAFTLAVTRDNVDLAQQFLRDGDTRTHRSLEGDDGRPAQLGVGLWGASRGFLAHWTVLRDRTIANYRVAIPSRVNMGTRAPGGQPGPVEKALLATPVIESRFGSPRDFRAIDLLRTIQSFDPCMSCSARLLVDGETEVLVRNLDTRFPA